MLKQLIVVCACAAVALLPVRNALADAGAAYGVNLLQNGDAEENFGAADASKIVKPSDWDTTGDFTVVQYGAKGEFPDISTPGTANKGMNLFEGGNAAISTASQEVELGWCGQDVDASSVHYTL